MLITDDRQLQLYREAGKRATEILWALRSAVAEGVTSLEIDALAFELCRKQEGKPNFVGVGDPRNLYRHATCISVNDTVLHGIPENRPLQRGDVVKIDFGFEYRGLNTDHCCTVVVGEFLHQKDEQLVRVTQQAVQAAAHQAIVGHRTGDIGSVLEKKVKQAGFCVVHEYVGHGIGRTLHEDPSVPAFGEPKTGALLKKGMVLCVEAQVLAGKPGLRQMPDGWTLKTKDGATAAMFEYMVVVGPEEPEFLTQTLAWDLVAG